MDSDMDDDRGPRRTMHAVSKLSSNAGGFSGQILSMTSCLKMLSARSPCPWGRREALLRPTRTCSIATVIMLQWAHDLHVHHPRFQHPLLQYPLICSPAQLVSTRSSLPLHSFLSYSPLWYLLHPNRPPPFLRTSTHSIHRPRWLASRSPASVSLPVSCLKSRVS
ncbi:hypothetical protein C8R45DRAFT_151571 [Mycena sanguinolenta]|nr:hypothetical protein C8R45DRAFT_151571 [Mycena sanguinolenta]